MTRPRASACYTAERAASLAGVPVSTVYYWARTGLVVPSVSSVKIKKWSYADLLVLRLVDWLRQDKDEDSKLPRASVAQIREQLWRSEELGERLIDKGVEVWVDGKGRLLFDEGRMYVDLGRQMRQPLITNSKVNLVLPFEEHPGMRGPNLVTPGPTLRIIPGKLSGEPHIADTRIPTPMVAALRERGLDPKDILELYPDLLTENVEAALRLEEQLEANLRVAA